HQPPPGLPEAKRGRGTVVRPLSPHRQRHLPHRQAAALPRRVEEPAQDGALDLRRPKLIGDLKHNVEVAKGGAGDVTPAELESYLGLAYSLPPGHLFRNAIPLNDFHYFVTSAGADVESAPPTAIAAAVQSFLHPDVRQVDAVNSQFGGKPKTPKKTKKHHKLPRSQVSVLVLNAGTVAGQASNTSYQLVTRGYTTKALPAGDQANAPKVQRDTTVYYDPVQANAQQAAEQLR